MAYLVLSLLQTLACALPALIPSANLTERSSSLDPLIAPGFTDTEEDQIRQGFKDACALAVAGLHASVSGNAIFYKYFPDPAVDTVHAVFKNIVGGDEVNCATVLEDITIRPDFAAGGDPAPICTNPNIFAGTAWGDTALPLTVLCPSALAHGGINTGTPGGPEAVTCDSISTDGDRVTYRMETVGSTLLHEYTHCAFVSNPPTVDKDIEGNGIYGPWAAQDHVISAYAGTAQTIATSYAWFANEAYWSSACNIHYDLAQDGDRIDPACGNAACQG